MKTKNLILLVVAFCSFSSLIPSVSAQGTAFTYQGRLDAAGSPANGIYDLEFRLFDAANGGTQQSGTWTQQTQGVTNGLFTVELDFGSFFPGTSRWLQIGVRTNGGSLYTILTPRQKFTATPYAITAGNFSGSITAAQLPAGVVTNSASGVNLTGNFSGNGANVTNVNATTLGGLSSAGFWKTNGNTGANPANGAFLGTTDNLPLEFWVNGARALRLEPNTNGAPNVVGGSPSNTVATAVEGATIAGGGLGLFPNTITASYATIGGGTFHTVAGAWATIGGGRDNTVAGSHATVSGGRQNTIQTNADFATIGGGKFNQAAVNEATVAGGAFNSALAYSATIGGGGGNAASGEWSTIAGGRDNQLTNADYATIGGGYQNTILNASPYANISGGVQNTIQTNAYSATISGGAQNTIQTNGYYSTIGGGVGNTIQNFATGSTIGGGYVNVIQANANDATIGGGQENTIQVNAGYSTIAGGSANVIQYNAGYAAIGGGSQNTIQSNAFAATIAGGWLNSAGANYAFAAGSRAKANHTAAFVWADSTGTDFTSTADNQFLIRAGGGVGINKNNPATALDVAGTVTATSFSGSGGSLTSLNAANLTGTITDARLSANVALRNASQTFAGLNLFNNANNSFAGTFTGTGTGLTALNAAQLTGGTVPVAALGNAWQIGGNGSTTPGTHFLGTTDNQALELKVNGARALRLEPNITSPNFVGGSPLNVVTNGYYGAVIAGGGVAGNPNRIGAYYASVLGGSGNTASGNYSVAMGLNTTAQGLYSTAMGRSTVAANDDATAMGLGCSALGWDTVAMGTYSVAGGHYSLAAGYYSQATNQSAFVWSDSSAIPGANSLINNSVTMRASGGYRLFSNSGSTAGVSLAANGTAWAVISDRNVKKDFTAVDSVAILEKLAAMPITQWHYKWEESGVTPHIGPMAQDFKAAFYPGTDDKSITTQEADGVALAAIQGLNEKVEGQSQHAKRQIAQLQTENADLRTRLEKLERMMSEKNGGAK